jgi:hypothetical protein
MLQHSSQGGGSYYSTCERSLKYGKQGKQDKPTSLEYVESHAA